MQASLGRPVFACALTDAPFIQKGPTPIEAEIRGTATLEVSASSTSAAAYQWLRDGVRIAGGTAQRLKLADIGYRDDALYSVIVANERASATSALPGAASVSRRA